MEKLTYSQSMCWLTCQKKWELRYKRALVSRKESKALRIGTNFHDTLAKLFSGIELPVVLDGVNQAYADRAMDESGKMIEEHAMQCGMAAAYNDIFPASKNDFNVLAVERPISGKITNPDSGFGSRTFDFAGVCDGLCEDSEGLFLMEHKTSSRIDASKIKQVSSFDTQICLYAHFLGQELKRPINKCLYNVVQKPTIKLKKSETPLDYSARVAQWYNENRQTVIFREFITITTEDKERALKVLWSVTQGILLASRNDFFCPNPGACEGKFGMLCDYYAICSSNENPTVIAAEYETKEANSELNKKLTF